jgi:hypothetical protein
MCVKIVGFNWNFKINQFNRWCKSSLPVKLFVLFFSLFNPSIIKEKQLYSTGNTLWIKLYEICFPQKYIIYPMKSVGVRSAILQLLFSAKSRPEPAVCLFPHWGIVRSCPLRVASDLPCTFRGYEHNTIRMQGLRKENFNPVSKRKFKECFYRL